MKASSNPVTETVEFLKEVLGPEIRSRREAANLTQLELATAAKVHVVSVSRIERGRSNFTIDTVIKLMRALRRAGA
jgi:transcriptional regulator with XRE-family HTH domain